MNKSHITLAILISALFSCNPGQKTIVTPIADDPRISVAEVERIERVLASDEMRGRKIFTPEIDRAADFIAAEFKNTGLQTWNNSNSFRQEFWLLRPKVVSLTGTINSRSLDPKEIVIVSTATRFKVTNSNNYEIARIKAEDNFGNTARNIVRANKHMVVTVDRKHAASFPNLERLKSNMFSRSTDVVFILTDEPLGQFDIEAEQKLDQQALANVVAVLPGKSKKDEFVIFSGHYDHIGVGKPVNGDSIFNGANDDAAGVTAMILLAKYYKAKNDNERTLVFAAFTAEESGGYGAQYFSKQFDPAKVIAMFNIEMIGTDSKWGKNSAFITGYEKTDLGAILQKNLQGSEFTFYPDPYPTQNLFYRSDNATLARLGVPAHTISTSKMDSEPNYHKVTDHVETLDLENMTRIIKSIAVSATSIIKGTDTPTRVAPESLR